MVHNRAIKSFFIMKPDELSRVKTYIYGITGSICNDIQDNENEISGSILLHRSTSDNNQRISPGHSVFLTEAGGCAFYTIPGDH